MTPSEKFCLTAQQFDAEYLLQISRGNQVIVTLSTSSMDQGEIKRFLIWSGDGINAEGDEDDDLVIWTLNVKEVGNVNAAWKVAVHHAYLCALNHCAAC